MTDQQPQQSDLQLPPIKLAFVLDGEVADILHTDDRLSAIFTSNPKVIDVTNELAADGTGIMVGAKYDETSKAFTNPAYTPPTPEQIAEAQKILEQAKAAGIN